jgi:hypothetical protein
MISWSIKVVAFEAGSSVVRTTFAPALTDVLVSVEVMLFAAFACPESNITDTETKAKKPSAARRDAVFTPRIFMSSGYLPTFLVRSEGAKIDTFEFITGHIRVQFR